MQREPLAVWWRPHAQSVSEDVPTPLAKSSEYRLDVFEVSQSGQHRDQPDEHWVFRMKVGFSRLHFNLKPTIRQLYRSRSTTKHQDGSSFPCDLSRRAGGDILRGPSPVGPPDAPAL